MKIEDQIKKETLYLLGFNIVFAAITIAVFLLIGKFDIYVLFGSLAGVALATLNFFLMGLSLQKAMNDEDELHRKQYLKFSLTMRITGMIIILVILIAVLKFNVYSTLLPILLQRISIAIRQIFIKKEMKNDEKND